MPPLGPFDAISCQFAYHYSFETEASARLSLQNISRVLRPGGYFFGTTTNAKVIRYTPIRNQALLLITMDVSRWCRERFRQSRDPMVISNPVYRIELARDSLERLHSQDYGVRYYFTLESAVEECPEYLIPMETLVPLARQHGLALEQVLSFPDAYMKYRQVPAFESLLHRMNVVGARDEFLSDEEREVAELYLIFCFRRQKTA